VLQEVELLIGGGCPEILSVVGFRLTTLLCSPWLNADFDSLITSALVFYCLELIDLIAVAKDILHVDDISRKQTLVSQLFSCLQFGMPWDEQLNGGRLPVLSCRRNRSQEGRLIRINMYNHGSPSSLLFLLHGSFFSNLLK
jgi:hypothetical protein